jgi:hypothetical protein
VASSLVTLTTPPALPKEAFEDETTVADELVALVQEQASLFHTTDGACFVTLNELPGKTYRLDSKLFSEWLGYAYFTATRTAVSDQALRAARNVLTGIATHEGEERQAFLRAARVGDRYYLDLGSDDWSVIEIQATGWRHLPRSPGHLLAVRNGPAPAAARPRRGSAISSGSMPTSPPRPASWSWRGCWRPGGPRRLSPSWSWSGSQGTAKSSTQAKIRQCLDPNAVDLRSAPKSVEDLFVSAGVNWLASFNNLSRLSSSTQDALCNLATGGGFAARTLFTNGDETLIEAKRPVILNGIVPTVTAQDLSGSRSSISSCRRLRPTGPRARSTRPFVAMLPASWAGCSICSSPPCPTCPASPSPSPPGWRILPGWARPWFWPYGADCRATLWPSTTTTVKTPPPVDLESSPVATAIRAMVERRQANLPDEPVDLWRQQGTPIQHDGQPAGAAERTSRQVRSLAEGPPAA